MMSKGGSFVRFTTMAMALFASAAPALASPPEKPKLIVAIAVDQFSSDLFNEYRPYFSAGLKRMTQGVVFPSGYQGHAATETCPGHSTILTGSRPSRTGIIANDWQDPKLERLDRSGKATHDIYCAEAPGVPGSNASAQVISTTFLRVPTLGDRMKVGDPQAKVVAVSGKDRAAAMMGGHRADLTLWWNGNAFVTYAGRDIQIAERLAAVNSRAKAVIAKPGLARLPAICKTHSYDLALSPSASVGTLKPRKAGDERGWRATPDFDTATLDAALAAVSGLRLGAGPSTDLLAISFSATDYTGHGFGTAGAEMCNQIIALDATLGQLFTKLDATKIPYAVVLTADHGGHDVPERNDVQGLPLAQRVDKALFASSVGAAVAKQLSLTANPILGRSTFGDMYLAASVPESQRKAVRDAAVAIYRNHPQVEVVFTKDELAATASPKGPVEDWSLIERARASFDAERSGDFVVLLKRYVTPIPDTNMGYFATHGSPWGYDRRVPILFWWKGGAPFEQPNGVETADIMPTLASLIDLAVPAEEIDGRCLDIVAGSESNCK